MIKLAIQAIEDRWIITGMRASLSHDFASFNFSLLDNRGELSGFKFKISKDHTINDIREMIYTIETRFQKHFGKSGEIA